MAINLEKGASVRLKDHMEDGYEKLYVGLNWGIITRKIFFNLFPLKIAVDLDGCAAAFDSNRRLLYTVNYNSLVSPDKALIHSGDDKSGDRHGDDGLDNEVITVNIPSISPDTQTIFFFLSSYKEQNFGEIPYSNIRVFAKTKKKKITSLVEFNLSSEDRFKFRNSMLLGKLYRDKVGEWNFQALGEPLQEIGFEEIIAILPKLFL